MTHVECCPGSRLNVSTNYKQTRPPHGHLPLYPPRQIVLAYRASLFAEISVVSVACSLFSSASLFAEISVVSVACSLFSSASLFAEISVVSEASSLFSRSDILFNCQELV